ncbi:MAG: hypothetical protein RSG52_12690 [Terrisporobacter sp.]|uniref:hypothetical protein n=1 Tax=Terrisporobacter sp. TaxID=1965305 RepID=UPI002FC64DE5
MNTIEIIRIAVGVSFILFGLGVYAYDKLHYMKYSEFRYSPISWLICILAGVYAMAYTVNIGIICVIVTLILWVITKIVVSNLIEKRAI